MDNLSKITANRPDSLLPSKRIAGGLETVSSLIEALSASARTRTVATGAEIQTALTSSVDEMVESAAGASFDESAVRRQAEDQLLGFGILQPLLDDPSIEEIWINSPSEIFVARKGIGEQIDLVMRANEVASIVERMLRPTGRRLDRSSPFVDASLPDGSRLHVVIPDVTRANWAVNIRKFTPNILTLDDLLAFGTLTSTQHAILQSAMQAGKNILVSGGTQSGKTTMLSALLAEVSSAERIISVEETFELRIASADWVAMQTRQPNLEGVGEVSLRRLVKEALRMRPGRIVVGEVREAESLDLLIALNSGLPGACTIHANTAADAITKLCTLPLLAGQNISSTFVNPTVGSCVDLVVHCTLEASGNRRVSEICSVSWSKELGEVVVDRKDSVDSKSGGPAGVHQ